MLTPLLDVHDLASELSLSMWLSGVQYCHIRVAWPFGLGFGEAPGHIQFHFVGRGSMLLHDVSGVTIWLEAGDAVLLPQGTPHALPSDPNTPCREVIGSESAKICDTVASIGVRVEAAPGGALIFNVCVELDLGDMQPLVGTMPGFMHVGTLPARYPEIRPTLDTMERKPYSERADSAGILTQLVGVVAVFIVCNWMKYDCGDTTGWVQALCEPKLGPTIVALHRDPGHNWSVTELTAQTDILRSVLTECSLAATGMTPAHYLTELRTWFVAQWIARNRETIEATVYRLGYESLAVFSCAFKRMVGRPPGVACTEGTETSA